MKKLFSILLSLVLFLSGCATYRFSHYDKAPYEKGYVASRADYTIPEYTIGKENSFPGLDLAKERFKRRRQIVEDYYKRMHYIDNYFKLAVWDPVIMFLKLLRGPFGLPFVVISDYRYNHNIAYREKVDRIEAERDTKEETRIASLKEKLALYIKGDLAKEERP